MSSWTRRRFLGTAAAAGAFASVPAWANPFGLPLGLQLYSVRDQLKTDYPGTLKQVAGLGYREVEAAGFYNLPPAQVKADMSAAGLRCVSAHYPASQLTQSLDAILDFHKRLGTARFIICAFPGFPPGSNAGNLPHPQQLDAFTLDVWRWNARQFNAWGKKVRDAGLQFGYHNHTMEFKPQNGTVPYDLLLKETDPELVVMELDCGWVTVGGGSPEHYIRTYPNRIKMLHVKDFAPDAGHSSIASPPPAAELGRGTADYPAIFQAVKPGSLQHIFVEQEDYPDMPWLEALRVDANYMKQLKS